ncbi:hypothetical protein NC653_039977 [Populus alba x Populus x berolinensis]|uniref:Uncharacterized protein n=1 Tax=Populus alba x Populus x berolinensis TaxID=444605 RepID=A0AAD6LCH9_9ROSI|nr:hypothetical protein NC653_039977 [Populus alba x Populus x berolinensis]
MQTFESKFNAIRCFFFNNLGKLRPKQAGDGSDRRFKDALRRRFLRQGLIILIIIMTDITIFTLNLLTSAVKDKEGRRRNNSNRKLRFSGDSTDNFYLKLAAFGISVEFCVCSSASEGIVMVNESFTVCSLFQERVGCNRDERERVAILFDTIIYRILSVTEEPVINRR